MCKTIWLFVRIVERKTNANYHDGDISRGCYIGEINKVEYHIEVDSLSKGDSMKYTIVEMTKEEYDALPDFEGF